MAAHVMTMMSFTSRRSDFYAEKMGEEVLHLVPVVGVERGAPRLVRKRESVPDRAVDTQDAVRRGDSEGRAGDAQRHRNSAKVRQRRQVSVYSITYMYTCFV